MQTQLYCTSTARGDKIRGPIQTIEWVMDVIYLRLKRPGREDGHSSTSCLVIYNLSYASVVWCAMEHAENFTFTLATGKY